MWFLPGSVDTATWFYDFPSDFSDLGHLVI